MESQQVALVDGLLFGGQQPHFVPAMEGFEEHVEKRTHLAGSIEAVQLFMEEGDDVADAIGMEAKIACVHWISGLRCRREILFSAEVRRNLTPVVGVPLAYLGDVAVGAEPVLGAVDIVPQLGSAGVLGQLAFAYFLPYPRHGVDRVGIDNLVQVVFLEVGEAVDDGQELADIVGALFGAVVEDTGSRGDVDALVFHHARVAAAGSVDGQRVEHWCIFCARFYGGHAVLVDDENTRSTRFSRYSSVAGDHTIIRQLDGRLGLGHAVEALVLRPLHAHDLLLTRVPVAVDARLPALPHHVVFLLLRHSFPRAKIQKFCHMEKMSYLCIRFQQEIVEALYLRLANGNVRNFYEMQEWYDGSRVIAWTVSISTFQGNSHGLH